LAGKILFELFIGFVYTAGFVKTGFVYGFDVTVGFLTSTLLLGYYFLT
jgi:hypothetical protein